MFTPTETASTAPNTTKGTINRDTPVDGGLSLLDAPTSAGSWGGGGVLFWFTSWVDGSVVGGAVEAGAFVLLPTGDNVDDEFVSVTK